MKEGDLSTNGGASPANPEWRAGIVSSQYAAHRSQASSTSDIVQAGSPATNTDPFARGKVTTIWVLAPPLNPFHLSLSQPAASGGCTVRSSGGCQAGLQRGNVCTCAGATDISVQANSLLAGLSAAICQRGRNRRRNAIKKINKIGTIKDEAIAF